MIDHSISNCCDPDSSSASFNPYKPCKNPPSRYRHYEVNSIFYIGDVDVATSDHIWIDLSNRNSIKFMAKINTGAQENISAKRILDKPGIITDL